jgi:hypothetical protein
MRRKLKEMNSESWEFSIVVEHLPNRIKEGGRATVREAGSQRREEKKKGF